MKSFSTERDTRRGTQSYMGRRRGRRELHGEEQREIEVTRRRRGVIKRGETDLANNQFPKRSPQPGTPKEIHSVG